MSSRIRFDSIFSLTNLAFNNVLSAASFSNQLPSDTVTPLQVNFGAAQSNDFIDLAADGTITFKQKGNYAIIIQGIFSRAGSSGQVAQINFRGTLNLFLSSPLLSYLAIFISSNASKNCIVAFRVTL